MSKLVSALSIVALVGCGDSGGDPTATVLNLIPYTAVQGSLDVEVTADMPSGVKRVELYAGLEPEPIATAKEAPYQLTFDTTLVRDGLTNVAVTVVGNDGKAHHSDIIPVIVLNTGEAAVIHDDDTGVLQIPAVIAGETDLRHYWETPTGIKQILAMVKWVPQEGQIDWDLELAIGQGICPHRGQQYGERDHSLTSPTVLTVSATEVAAAAEFFPETPASYDPLTELYFLHLSTLNLEEHLSEAVPYSIEVFLLR